jgi:hypothetical protein
LELTLQHSASLLFFCRLFGSPNQIVTKGYDD